MTFVPHSEAERRQMLDAVGIEDLEELFADVPARVRFPQLDLPPPISQHELAVEMRALAARNIDTQDRPSFLGGGTYRHYRPATVDHVLQRGEFATSYTPYQAEISQGMLQAMFEYQTMVCRLTGMEVSNASHYDGATSLAEAILLALAVSSPPRSKIVLSPTVHPQWREVAKTYLKGADARVVGDADPMQSEADVAALVDADTAAVVVQSPNFFGQLEDLRQISTVCRTAGALFIVAVDPIALGLFEAPGACGADIVVADGQSLGLPPSFGGPSLGIFATRRDLVRRIPGRLVGQTTDAHGRRGYVLTLATREQHIRRARATSNICTNAALSALAASVYLATLGKQGVRHIAELCYHKSHYAAAQIAKLANVTINPQAPGKPFFKEFVVELPRPVAEVNEVLLRDFGVIGGLDLGRMFEAHTCRTLVAVTETASKADIERLVDGLRSALT
ncbi:MAG: aminomethyl-transferring glycine dehydrogenase subunit GcvPA [Hyphomicrobiaceae bacterium]